ncbi:MAG: hypothetical protein ACMVO5_05905 [Polymorphobacter sp.]|uniref:phage fiber-tail adaptor protein n=1 Tax=Polymorphobacter sp. TaxID=1909290 RepID=UPI003A8984CC
MTMYAKDPAAALGYGVDWAADYLTGQSIAASSWAVVPAEAGGLMAETPLIEGGRTLVTLTGGRAGCVYRVTNQVTFSDGGRDERSLLVRVEER